MILPIMFLSLFFVKILFFYKMKAVKRVNDYLNLMSSLFRCVGWHPPFFRFQMMSSEENITIVIARDDLKGIICIHVLWLITVWEKNRERAFKMEKKERKKQKDIHLTLFLGLLQLYKNKERTLFVGVKTGKIEVRFLVQNIYADVTYKFRMNIFWDRVHITFPKSSFQLQMFTTFDLKTIASFLLIIDANFKSFQVFFNNILETFF